MWPKISGVHSGASPSLTTYASERCRSRVKPTHVVQVRFAEWTADGRLRHAYNALRSDKDTHEVNRR